MNLLEKSLQTLPKRENIAVRYYNKKHQLIFVTSYDTVLSTYKLYEVKNDKLIFTKHKSNTANILEKYINYDKEV